MRGWRYGQRHDHRATRLNQTEKPTSRRAAGLVWRLATIAAFGMLLAALGGALPSGRSTGAVIVRGLVGLCAGVLIVAVVRRSMRSLADPPPPQPETVDARSADVVYVCGICGTRLRLEVAATGKPPRHCGEEMEPRLDVR